MQHTTQTGTKTLGSGAASIGRQGQRAGNLTSLQRRLGDELLTQPGGQPPATKEAGLGLTALWEPGTGKPMGLAGY